MTTRSAQLRALGNGVVPAQAVHALRELAADTAHTEAANLLTRHLARTPRRHTPRTRHADHRPRPPPHPRAATPHSPTATNTPPQHHTPSPKKGHTP